MELRQTLREAVGIVRFLIEHGLSDDQNFPFQSGQQIVFNNSEKLSLALKARPYPEIYGDLSRERVFTVKLPDAALLQMNYEWAGGHLVKHRLAYMPNPNLISFQEAPELYEDDVIYADILNRSSVVVPLRFDFDVSEEAVEELWHPVSHLTLGSFENCRIAVSSAVPPAQFVGFVLRAFYGRKMRELHDRFPKYALPVGDVDAVRTITKGEESHLHLSIPIVSAS